MSTFRYRSAPYGVNETSSPGSSTTEMSAVGPIQSPVRSGRDCAPAAAATPSASATRAHVVRMGGELYPRYAAARSTINLAHGLNGVSFGRHFIDPIALHARESQRKPTRVVRAPLHIGTQRDHLTVENHLPGRQPSRRFHDVRHRRRDLPQIP